MASAASRRRLSGATWRHGPWVLAHCTTRFLIRTALLLRNPVERVVRLAHVAHGAADRDVGRAARDDLAVLIHVGHGDLHRGVVLGLDQAAGRRALARHVQVNKVALRTRSVPRPRLAARHAR